VRGPKPGELYGYQPAERPVIEKASRIADVCARHGVPLAAAALQFPLGHPSVVSIIPGPVSPEEVRLNLGSFRQAIPDQLWEELKAEKLIRTDAPTPKSGR
jgi:D-threo-aldose 1-dehydrogenase